MEGFLLVNKPPGIPTFKLVTRVRHLTNIKKVGFSGTLDPFASGLIIMGIGRQYTKQLDHFHNYPKHYRTTLVLGMETDTLDAYGTVTKTSQNDPTITTSNDHIRWRSSEDKTLSHIHIRRCRQANKCRTRWSPYQ